MLKKSYLIVVLFMLILLNNGCGLVTDIFEAGVVFGILISVAIAVLLIWGIVKLIKKIKH